MSHRDLVTLPPDEPYWERFLSVFPLVLVATMEEWGEHDIAPKHMAMPMGWDNWFGFVCSPRHGTWRNAVRTGVFTVSYAPPSQVLLTSFAAAPRCGPHKPALEALEVFPAQVVEGVLVEHCAVHLECELHETVEGLGECGLIIGRVVAAHAHPDVLLDADRDDNDLLARHPLLAYLHPGRFAVVAESQGFPWPAGFRR